MDYLVFFCPHIPPAPSPPAGTKGSFNSPFGCVAPTAVLLALGFAACGGGGGGGGPCGAAFVSPLPPRPFTPAGVKGGFSSPFGCVAPNTVLPASGWVVPACEVRASERARCCSRPFGRAEQRSGARIRAGACLSEASLRLTPSGASSARQPAGPRSSARLFFGYFLLAKQKKVARPKGRNPVSPNSQAKSLLLRKVTQ